MAALLGGFLYSRLAVVPASRELPAASRDLLGDRAAAAYRPLAWAAIAGLLISGTYNLLNMPGHTPRYHMILGFKLLLAAHVFAIAVLASRPKNARRARLATGAIISGLAIVLISAYLRRIF